MLDLLARSGRQLAEVGAALPAVHMVHETVVTPWEQKGLVMRSLVEQADGELVLVDGVKVCHEQDWVLALPDPEEPVTHVWAEATSDGRGPRALPRSTPAASARWCADGRPGAAGPRWRGPAGDRRQGNCYRRGH